jgi:HEAT repeat protein
VFAVAGFVWKNYDRVAGEPESQFAENAVGSLAAVETLAKRGPEALPVLLAAVDSSDARERWLAVYGLGRLGPAATDALGKIQDRLNDDNAKVRENAAAAMVRVDAEDAARHIAPMLADPESSVRNVVSTELVRIGPTALPVLEDLLHDDRAPVRLEAVRVLRSTFDLGAQLKWHQSNGKVNLAIRNAVADPDRAVHLEAVVTAAQYGETTPEEIRELLETGVSEHRQITLSAIPKLGDDGAQFLPEVMALLDDDAATGADTDVLLSRERTIVLTRLKFALTILDGMKHVALPAVDRLVEIGKRRPGETSLAVVRTLQRIGADEVDIFQVLMPLIKGDDRRYIWHAGQLLAKEYHQEARKQVALLVPRLGTNETSVDKSVLFAIYALGSQGQEAVGALIPLLNNRDAWVAEFAAHALGEIGLGSVKGAPDLAAVVANPSASLKQRWACARALSDIGRNVCPVVPALLDLIDRPEPTTRPPIGRFGESEWEIRAMVVKALGSAGEDDSDVIRAVRAQLSSPSTAVRAEAAQALGRVAAHSDEVLKELIRKLRDDVAECRIAAANGIGLMKINRRAAVKPLISLLSDDEYPVADAGARALGNLGADAHDALPTLRELAGEESHAAGNRRPHVLAATRAAIKAIKADMAKSGSSPTIE